MIVRQNNQGSMGGCATRQRARRDLRVLVAAFPDVRNQPDPTGQRPDSAGCAREKRSPPRPGTPRRLPAGSRAPPAEVIAPVTMLPIGVVPM
jgi:hypothetical protein